MFYDTEFQPHLTCDYIDGGGNDDQDDGDDDDDDDDSGFVVFLSEEPN